MMPAGLRSLGRDCRARESHSITHTRDGSTGRNIKPRDALGHTFAGDGQSQGVTIEVEWLAGL